MVCAISYKKQMVAWGIQGTKPTANVFPEPVWAMPTMSRPDNAIGQPCACIAVGVDQFCIRITFIM